MLVLALMGGAGDRHLGLAGSEPVGGEPDEGKRLERLHAASERGHAARVAGAGQYPACGVGDCNVAPDPCLDDIATPDRREDRRLMSIHAPTLTAES